jgi:hypothetical protein
VKQASTEFDALRSKMQRLNFQIQHIQYAHYRTCMTKHYPSKSGMALNGLYLVCVIAFVTGIIYNHFKLISHAFPLDYNETGMLVVTSTIAQGDNPYSLESQPTRISLYPVLYNIVVAPLSNVFGNTLELHRIVSGVFIMGCAALCFYLCRRASGTRTDSFVAAALVYAALLFYSTPIASPNSFGLFLFLCAITVPWVNNFSTRSLVVAILLGILAFFTKQYFIASLGYVALYLFLAESKKRGIYFGLAALVALIAALALVCYFSPYFLQDTVFAVGITAKLASSDKIVIPQFRKYAIIYLPLLAIVVMAIARNFYSRIITQPLKRQDWQKPFLLNVADLDKPLLVHKPNYIWVCFSCSVIITAFVLAKNRGNHLTYLFQLISPFLLVGTFALISGVAKWRWPVRILIVFALYNSYFMLPTDFSVEEANWRIIRKEIAEADDVYASTLVLQEILEKDAPVYQNGHTRYFIFSKDLPSWLGSTDQAHTLQEIWKRYIELIQGKIRNQEFDLLLMDEAMYLPSMMKSSENETEVLLHKYYAQTADLTLPLAKRLGGGDYRVRIWKPIRTATEKDSPQPR